VNASSSNPRRTCHRYQGKGYNFPPLFFMLGQRTRKSETGFQPRRLTGGVFLLPAGQFTLGGTTRISSRPWKKGDLYFREPGEIKCI
jgi:hypothetical protein